MHIILFNAIPARGTYLHMENKHIHKNVNWNREKGKTNGETNMQIVAR